MITASICDKNLVVEILTAAFINNKRTNYLIPQDSRKLYRIQKMMEYAFQMCLLFGKVLLCNNRKACALVFYPDKKILTITSAILDVKLIFNAIGFGNIIKAARWQSRVKSIHPNYPMAYLWFIGVDPKYQQLGLGKKLMEEVIILTQQDKRPIFLETSTISNLSWCMRFGFEVYHKFDFSYQVFFLRFPLSVSKLS